jgi:hypothetical protein
MMLRRAAKPSAGFWGDPRLPTTPSPTLQFSARAAGLRTRFRDEAVLANRPGVVTQRAHLPPCDGRLPGRRLARRCVGRNINPTIAGRPSPRAARSRTLVRCSDRAVHPGWHLRERRSARISADRALRLEVFRPRDRAAASGGAVPSGSLTANRGVDALDVAPDRVGVGSREGARRAPLIPTSTSRYGRPPVTDNDVPLGPVCRRHPAADRVPGRKAAGAQDQGARRVRHDAVSGGRWRTRPDSNRRSPA